MEQESFSVLSILVASSAFLAWQFALAGLLSKATPKPILPMILFFCLGWFQWHSFGIVSGKLVRLPHLYLTNLPLTALFGPLLYHLVSQFWMEKKTKIHWIELIPFFLVFLYLLPIYWQSAELKKELLATAWERRPPFDLQMLLFFVDVWTFFYLFKSFLALYPLLNASLIRKNGKILFLLGILFLTTIACLSGLSLFWVSPLETVSYLSFSIACIIFLLFVLRERYPSFFHQVQVILLTEKKKRTSQLQNLDLSDLENRLFQSLHQEKLYREEGFSLPSWARHLGISQHQLSEFLNTHLKMNFFQITNKVRIQEAQKICLQEPKKSILHIAYEVGFPSKSTFYEAFRKETGQTPQEFRKSQKKNPAR